MPSAREALHLLDEEFRRGEGEAQAPPSVFYLNLTERCQLRCAHCITRAPARTRDGTARDLLPGVLEALRPHLRFARYVGLTHAGEPMLSPSFLPLLDLLADARRGDCVVHLLTNGMAMTEARFLDAARRGLRSLSFSLDGLSEQTNDRLREGAQVSLLLPRIRALATLRTSLGLDVRMGISWTLTTSNAHELEDAVRFSADAGLDWLKVEEVFPVNERGALEQYDERSARERAAAAIEAGEALGLVVVDHTRAWQVYKCGEGRVDDEMRRFSSADDFANRLDINPCRMPWEVVCVEPDGTVKPLGFHHEPAGNVLRDDLSALWNAPPFVRARRLARMMRPCREGPTTCPPAPGAT